MSVQIQNTLGRDVKTIHLTVIPVDQNTIIITNGVVHQEQANIGTYARRVYEFPVSVSTEALEGSYLIKITANMDGTTIPKDIMLHVKK